MSEQTQKTPPTPDPQTPVSEAPASGKKTLSLGGGRLTLGGTPPPRHGMPGRGHARDVKVEVVRRRPTSSFRKMPPPEAVPAAEPQLSTPTTTDTSATTAPETTAKGTTAPAANTPGLGRKTTDSTPEPANAPTPSAQPITAVEAAVPPTVPPTVPPSGGRGQHRSAPADELRLTIEPTHPRQSKRRTATDGPKKPNLNRREPIVRRRGKITITEALGGGETIRQRSLASVRRARMRDKARSRDDGSTQPKIKQIREVIIPDVITVQELSNRMAERAASTIKELMRLGILVTAPQTIDAETAELVVLEMGHKVRRISDADVDIITNSDDDDPAQRKPRPPVVTVMGHVDHGKTSILDAIRKADVALGEEGGITQHIGAYQINSDSGNTITFIDTPGHEAFTEMRVRGANITDIVVLVVAADDGVMPQTVEAIAHAKAAGCPIIVAINKCDKPDADPKRIRNELLNHEVITEEYGGETLAVEISAKQGTGLEALEEAIMLQAELLELTANPDSTAEGAVIEAKMERGRGSVASVLVTRGTLKVGDIFVVGAEMGRVRAMVDASQRSVAEARPSDAVEVLGLGGTPLAGDSLTVVESEARAREVAQYRGRRLRNKEAATVGRGSVEAMLSALAAGEAQELPLVLKTDVHGSLEAIRTAIDKLGTDQVKARILSSSVGAINESDINLAAASAGLVLAFNVRANPQARSQASRDGVEIRYHSIIYQLLDEVKTAMSGLLSPTRKEEFIGYAEIREVFSISKIGKIAGCLITEGIIKRGCSVRLLRNSVVVHEGSLKTLKRFKDEVNEAREGQECGMAFENYDDIAVGDVIECFEIINIARTIDG